jgi:hypothetical protein
VSAFAIEAAHSAMQGVLPCLKSMVSGSVPVVAIRLLIRSRVKLLRITGISPDSITEIPHP